MTVMRTVGTGHRPPAHANVREDACGYVIQLDVSDFLESELTVEVVGQRVTVRGAQEEEPGDDTAAFRLHERLEESFRLPDDADADLIYVFYEHGALAIHVPRRRLEPRSVPIQHRSPYVVNRDAVPC